MAVRAGAWDVSGNSRTDFARPARPPPPVTSLPQADAVIVGGGLLGLCCAAVLARDGAEIVLLDEHRPGAASGAAAGMLAPSIDRGKGPATDFALAARDMYRGFLAWLEESTGLSIPLNDLGVLQVAITEAGVRGLRRAMAREADPDAEWLDSRSLHALEPALSHALGGVFHPRDGAVDNVALLAALVAYCRSAASVHHVRTPTTSIVEDGGGLAVRSSTGDTYRGRYVILAAGAWAPLIDGLPRALPVVPLRGQMLAFHGGPLRHVVFGPRGYLVPRPASSAGAATAETLAGATSERVGFDPGTTRGARASLQSAAVEILPALASSAPLRQWAGLRPMTPDLLPIIGADPAWRSLLYACGHSRNGVLMAPLTAHCLSAAVRGDATPHDLTPFSIERFSRA